MRFIFYERISLDDSSSPNTEPSELSPSASGSYANNAGTFDGRCVKSRHAFNSLYSCHSCRYLSRPSHSVRYVYTLIDHALIVVNRKLARQRYRTAMILWSACIMCVWEICVHITSLPERTTNKLRVLLSGSTKPVVELTLRATFGQEISTLFNRHHHPVRDCVTCLISCLFVTGHVWLVT